MVRRVIPAVFMRGGTSKGLIFHERDLPRDRAGWVPLFDGATGSPDPFGRQLDGMGGEISSFSKVCVIGAPTREDAELDYTFVQVKMTEEGLVPCSNCGNMSASVGPFAFDEGLVRSAAGPCDERIPNTNTNTNTAKIIHSSFAVESSRARYDGPFRIPGVSAGGSPVRLDFLDPGGANTGRLVPTGQSRDTVSGARDTNFTLSMVDTANAVGARGDELPGEHDENPDPVVRLEAIRREASVHMGITPHLDAAAQIPSVPFICLNSGPAASTTLSGANLAASDAELDGPFGDVLPHRAPTL